MERISDAESDALLEAGAVARPHRARGRIPRVDAASAVVARRDGRGGDADREHHDDRRRSYQGESAMCPLAHAGAHGVDVDIARRKPAPRRAADHAGRASIAPSGKRP
jgi:hypothetical protein